MEKEKGQGLASRLSKQAGITQHCNLRSCKQKVPYENESGRLKSLSS